MAGAPVWGSGQSLLALSLCYVGKNGAQEAFVPARALALDRERGLRGILPDDVEGAPPQHGDVPRRVILPVARGIFAEGDVQLPVQGVSKPQ